MTKHFVSASYDYYDKCQVSIYFELEKVISVSYSNVIPTYLLIIKEQQDICYENFTMKEM